MDAIANVMAWITTQPWCEGNSVALTAVLGVVTPFVLRLAFFFFFFLTRQPQAAVPGMPYPYPHQQPQQGGGIWQWLKGPMQWLATILLLGIVLNAPLTSMLLVIVWSIIIYMWWNNTGTYPVSAIWQSITTAGTSSSQSWSSTILDTVRGGSDDPTTTTTTTSTTAATATNTAAKTTTIITRSLPPLWMLVLTFLLSWFVCALIADILKTQWRYIKRFVRRSLWRCLQGIIFVPYYIVTSIFHVFRVTFGFGWQPQAHAQAQAQAQAQHNVYSTINEKRKGPQRYYLQEEEYGDDDEVVVEEKREGCYDLYDNDDGSRSMYKNSQPSMMESILERSRQFLLDNDDEYDEEEDEDYVYHEEMEEDDDDEFNQNDYEPEDDLDDIIVRMPRRSNRLWERGL